MSKDASKYDPYDSDHPINVAKRTRPWLMNRLADGKINQEYADNFCIHSLMVGKPSANRSRETGEGCGCRLEVWVQQHGWPLVMTYEEWMEIYQT